jgi:protein-tyrosine-phosphatase
MAEAFARRHGGDRIEAHSAGSRPSGQVNARAILFMEEVDYDLTQHRSKSLEDIPDVEYDVAVTMGCGDECPLVRARRRVAWNIPDPKILPPPQFRAVRDQIEQQVQALLQDLTD